MAADKTSNQWRMRPAAIVLAASVVLCATFAATGPWTVGTYELRYWQTPFAICILAFLATLLARSTRASARELLTRDISFSRRAILIAFAIASAFLIQLSLRQYHALEVNAWDFSNSFDRPIEQTLHGNVLWSETLGRSMLSIHCNWIDFLFVPLYAIVATPYWLLLAHPLAISGAALLLFLYVRHASNDDLIAACVALAFFFNRYTVRVGRLGFLADVFYPLAFFLLLYAVRRGSWRLGAAGLLLALSVKEDAVLPLVSFAMLAALFHKRPRWAAATAAVALAAFAFNYFYALPKFGGPPVPFSFYWGSFGDTPLSAAGAMLRDPLEVLRRLGAPALTLLSTVAFVPLAGYEGLLAALPSLVVYTSSDLPDMHWLALHYSLPFLAFIFVSTASGIERLGRTTKARRVIALVVLTASMFSGSGYKLDRARAERHHIDGFLAAAGSRTVYIQGALYPHAGYASRHRVLHHRVALEAESAFLLCDTCTPYPFTREELQRRSGELRSNRRYQKTRSGDLWLFVPR